MLEAAGWLEIIGSFGALGMLLFVVQWVLRFFGERHKETTAKLEALSDRVLKALEQNQAITQASTQALTEMADRLTEAVEEATRCQAEALAELSTSLQTTERLRRIEQMLGGLSGDAKRTAPSAPGR